MRLTYKRFSVLAATETKADTLSFGQCTVPISISVRLSPHFFVISMGLYTGCNRRNGPDFGRVFLRSYYTDITQNTYIQS